MNIEFSEHAQARLQRRPQITRAMVVQTVQTPDSVRVSYRGRSIFTKQFGDWLLEVVAVVESDTIIVVTQYIQDQL